MSKASIILLRVVVFAAVFLVVMSISFLVEAQDLPVDVQHVEAQPSDVSNVSHSEPFELIDLRQGIASWYGRQFHGRRTASGRRYNMHELTAAHRTLPFGTLVRVLNPVTGKRIVVEITDRGPFIRRRIIDLSYAAAQILDVSTTRVELEAVRPKDVASHYAGNINTVIVIDADSEFHSVSSSLVEQIGEPTTFTKAVSSLDIHQVVVIIDDELGKGNRYATARLLPGRTTLQPREISFVQ